MKMFNKKENKTIEICIPKGFMNCGVSICNHFIADTNNSANWDTLKFPLPKAKHIWQIKGYRNNNKTVILIDKK